MNTQPIRIDLVSDTATRPGEAMREAMVEAPVGDEQLGEDPTVLALTRQVAKLLGQQDALFLPSGTMCNQIALAVHCQAGDEIIAADGSHIIAYEGAGAAVFASSLIRAIPTPSGIFTAEQLNRAIRPVFAKMPRARLVSLEQTHNQGGGAVWARADIEAIAQSARDSGLLLHMDGARLMNAVIATGVSAADFATHFDSVWIDLSKGLGCPVGAVLAGSHSFIEKANIWKHRLGGAMRQAGIIAAAGLYALEHNVERLAEDHANAKKLAHGLAQLPGILIDPDMIETNLVFFTISSSTNNALLVSEELARRGIRIGVYTENTMRAVTHLDISAQDIDETLKAMSDILTMD